MNDRSLASLVLIGGGLALMWWYRQVLPKGAAPTGLDSETHVPKGGGMGDKKAYDYPTSAPTNGGPLQQEYPWPLEAMKRAWKLKPVPGWPSARTPGINPAANAEPFSAEAALAELGGLWT